MSVLDLPTALAITLLGSLAIGSFLNVVIARLPARLQGQWDAVPDDSSGQVPPGISRPRSHCPACRHTLPWRENIPLVSYAMLRGQCSACGVAISLRYPLVEALTAVASVIVTWKLGLEWQTLAALLLTWTLIALAFIDLEHLLLPDRLTLPLLSAGLLVNAAAGFTDLQSALVGAVAGYGVLWAVYHGYRLLTGREGFGYGDFKLLAALGAWLGWQLLPLIVLLAAVVGTLIGTLLIFARRHQSHQPLPFGPYLAAAGWIALLWGDQLTRAYLHITGLGL